MSEMSRLRMELKADLELISIRQGDMARQMEAMSRRIEDQGQRIEDQAGEINQHARETAKLGREVAEKSRWVQGRTRLVQQRFDTILEVAERERALEHSLLLDLQTQQQALESRVTRLEEGPSSAA